MYKAPSIQSVWFSLAPSIFAARCGSSVILLDVAKDKYFSLIEGAAVYFALICESELAVQEKGYSLHSPDQASEPEELNRWITEFIEKGYIVASTVEPKRTIAPLPLKPGGLCNYRWDSKHSWTPFAKASKFGIIKALIQLSKVHKLLKERQLKDAMQQIESFSGSKLIKPDIQSMDRLAAAVDAASLLYPKKTYCLAWAMTFALLALKKGWDVQFVIGVQATPFYAHAWAESSGHVINDDPCVKEALSMIYREPS